MEYNIFSNLSWNAPLESQEKTIKELSSMVNLNVITLLQPLGKEYWENAAKVLCMIGYPQIEIAIPGLFVWLQDMNWPGSMVVMEILKLLPKDVFVRYLESATKEAISLKDEIWIINLAVFLDDFKLEEYDFMSKEIYSELLNAVE